MAGAASPRAPPMKAVPMATSARTSRRRRRARSTARTACRRPEAATRSLQPNWPHAPRDAAVDIALDHRELAHRELFVVLDAQVRLRQIEVVHLAEVGQPVDVVIGD